MNPEIKAEWLKRLRSKDYKQTTGTLHDITNNKYCCLGVLAEMGVEAGVCEKMETEYEYVHLGRVRINSYGGNRMTGWLPQEIIMWAGISSQDPFVHPFPAAETHHTLSYYNDTGMSFEDIADLIEKEM